MPDKSVFSRLAKFCNQREEDFFTEIFAHVLECDPELRRKVLHKAFGKELELAEVSIATQERDDDSNKCPDMTIKTKDELILIENKVRASGSKQQLEEYAKTLNRQRDGRKPYLLYLTKKAEPTPASQTELVTHCEGLHFKHLRWYDVFAVLESHLEKNGTHSILIEFKKFMEEKHMAKKRSFKQENIVALRDFLNPQGAINTYKKHLEEICKNLKKRFSEVSGEIKVKLKDDPELYIEVHQEKTNLWFELGISDENNKSVAAFINLHYKNNSLNEWAKKTLQHSRWSSDNEGYYYVEPLSDFIGDDGWSALELSLDNACSEVMHFFNVLTQEEMQTVLDDLTPNFEKAFEKGTTENLGGMLPDACFQNGNTYFGFWSNSTEDFCKDKEAFPHVCFVLRRTGSIKRNNKQVAQAFADKNKSKNWRLDSNGKLWTGKSLADFTDEPNIVEAVKKWFEDRLKEAAKGWIEDEA